MKPARDAHERQINESIFIGFGASVLIGGRADLRVTNIGYLGSEHAIGPAAINAGCSIAGSATLSQGMGCAFLWSAGAMKAIYDGYNSVGYALNDSNEVVGYKYGPFANYHAFLYSNGFIRDLGALGGDESEARGINNAGQIVGYSFINQDGNSPYHAFLYQNGAMQDLGTLCGPSSEAEAINPSGQIAGWSDPAGGGKVHAFPYSTGSMKDLGVMAGGSYSWAWAINASGQVVGYGDTATHDPAAFLYSGGKMTDLNTVLDSSGAIYYLTFATGINDRGYIASDATDCLSDEDADALLLTPYWTDSPSMFSIGAGKYVSGSVFNLANIDQNYLTLQSGPTFSNGAPPLSIVLTGASTLANPTDVRMNLTGHADSVDLAETVEFYDYVAGAWVLVDSTTATTSDSSLTAISTNPARFVQSGTLQMKARISLKPSGPISKSPWSLYLDQAVWNVSP